jgi:hypothetical protein
MKEFPYRVVTKRLGFAADRWCTDQFGRRWFAVDYNCGVWTCFWAGRDSSKYYNWYFEHEKDAVLFSLVWS